MNTLDYPLNEEQLKRMYDKAMDNHLIKSIIKELELQTGERFDDFDLDVKVSICDGIYRGHAIHQVKKYFSKKFKWYHITLIKVGIDTGASDDVIDIAIKRLLICGI